MPWNSSQLSLDANASQMDPDQAFLMSLLNQPAQASQPVQAKKEVTKNVTKPKSAWLNPKMKASIAGLEDAPVNPTPTPEPTNTIVAPPTSQALPQGPAPIDRGQAYMDQLKKFQAMAQVGTDASQFGPQPVGGKVSQSGSTAGLFKTLINKNIPVDLQEYGLLHQAVANSPESQDLAVKNAEFSDLVAKYSGEPTEKPGINLSGAAELVDFLNNGKTKFAAQYKAPKTAEEIRNERYKTLLALKDKEAENQRDYTKSIMASIAPMLRGGGQMQSADQIATKIDNTVGVTNTPPRGDGRPQVNNPLEKTWAVFEKQSAPQIKAVDASQEARGLLAQGYGPADEILKRKLIVASGDSKPSDKDLQSFSGDKRIVERMKQYINYAFGTGSFTDLNREEMSALIDGLEKSARARLAAKVSGHAASAKAAHGIDPNTATKFINDRLSLPKEAAPVKAPPSFMEYLDAKKKAQGAKNGG